MALREFYSLSAAASRDDPHTAPLFSNSVLARTSAPRMTAVSRLLTWVLAALLIAATLLGAGYWGYRQMQPRPLFAPVSASELAAAPAAAVGGAPDRQR